MLGGHGRRSLATPSRALQIAGVVVVIMLFVFIRNRGTTTSGTISSSKLTDMQRNDDLDRPDFSEMTTEQVAAYWNSRPCNLRHSQKQVGTKEYYNDVETRKYRVEPHIPKFAQFAKWKGKRVLEVGCGMATDGINFARNGAEYHAVDLSAESIKLAKKRFEVFGLEGDIQEANAEKLSTYFDNDMKFDLVYSFGVIHHTPHPERVIAEIKKILRPGGTIKLMLYSKISFKLFWIMKETNIWDFSKMDALIAKYSEAQVGSPVTYSYTFGGVAELLGDDFVINEIYKDHIFKYDIEAYRNYEYKLDEMWEKVPPETFRELESELGWHTMVTATYQPKE